MQRLIAHPAAMGPMLAALPVLPRLELLLPIVVGLELLHTS